MRKVFSNDMVAHVWSQQEQDEGRSSNGNFYFQGPTIYSYRMGYPVGNFVKGKKGETVVLIWDGSYSVTTSHHQSMAARSSRHHKQFSVPHLLTRYSGYSDEEAHKRNIDAMASAIMGEVADAMKASHNLNMNCRRYALGAYGLRQRHARLLDYCKVFGLKVPPAIKKINVDDILAEYDANRIAAQNNADQKGRELLAKLGSQEAVRAYHERRALLSKVSKVKGLCNGTLFHRLGNNEHVPYDARRSFSNVRDELEKWLEHEYDATIRKHHEAFQAVNSVAIAHAEAQAARYEAEKQAQAQRDIAEHGEFGGWTNEQQVKYVVGHPHRTHWLTSDQREAAWRAGHNIRLDRGGHALMRLSSDGQTIETSQHASFPREHGVKAWRLLKIVLQRGEAWQRNGQEIRLGHFQIDRVDASGTVFAGCHTVERSEVEHMARLLGLETIDTLPLNLIAE